MAEEKPVVENTEEVAEATEEVQVEAKITKAGPKARKAQAEAEAEAERKETAAAKVEAKPAKAQSKPNPQKQHGKKYREVAKLVDRDAQYELGEGIALAQKTSAVKFDATIEMHVNLGVDPRQADQMVRASVTLPAGTGKTLRVAVLALEAKHAEAKRAGADVVGAEDLIAIIEKGQIDFDKLIATPDMMPKLSKLAKVLGPKGLMPNPKSGSVTADVAKAVTEAKAGRVEYRIDKQAIVHQAIGKVSFKSEELLANAKTFIDSIMKNKPAAAKGTYVKAIAITTSMGPGIKLNVTKTIAEANPKK